MSPGESPDDAAVFDFLDEFLRDLERGKRQPLTFYLARYRGHEEAVAGEYFAELERAGLLARAPAAAPQNGAEHDPQRVGPYKLVRELGRGGQGAVWLAEDTRIARHVALKLLPAEFAALSQERRRRLQREAEVIAKLDHPSLCAVLEARIDGERPYIAMRYVEGATLGEWIVRAREARRAAREEGAAPKREGALHLAPRTALEQASLLRFFERTARALHAAHEAGVVHRDVKPQNLMVTRSGDPVVLDFGQARDETSDSFELTRSGDVLGTPAYMSPEQILGRREAVDRRSDVWALGASLYEALTLTRPFEADSVPALFLAIRETPLVDPRARNPALSQELAVVVATALEKEPERRYASALELAEDLRRVCEYEPIRARPPGAWRLFRGWCRRHPAIVVTMLALSAGLASTLYQLSEKNAALENAVGRHLGRRVDELLEEDPAAALELGIEAVRRAPGYQTRASLFRALQACHLRALIDGSPAHQAHDASLSADGRTVAVALGRGGKENDYEGGVRVCAVESGAVLAEIDAHRTDARLVCLSQDGSRVGFVSALVAPDGTVVAHAAVADARSGELLAGAPLPLGEPRAVELFESGRTLVAVSEGGAVALDAGDGLARWTFEPGPGRRILGAKPHRGAGRVLMWGDERAGASALGWLADAATGTLVAELRAPGKLLSAEFRPDGAAFVTSSDDGTLRVWNAATGALERTLERLAPGKHARVVDWSADGQRLAVLLEDAASRDARAAVVYAATGASLLLGAPGVRVLHAAFSPDGERLATVGSDMLVRIWSGPANQTHESFRGIFAPKRVLWSSDGRRLVTLAIGSTLSVWYAGARPDVYALRGGGGAVLGARFSPDGERVVVASEDGKARVWSTPAADAREERPAASEAGELLFALSHRGAVRAAAYSPDGACIATAGEDGSARLWDAASGRELATLLQDAPPLGEVAFSRDGAAVAVRSAETAAGPGAAGRVWICAARAGGPARELELGAPASAMGWLWDPARLATGHVDGRMRVFDGASGALLATHECRRKSPDSALGVLALAVRGDGEEVALACSDGAARFVRPRSVGEEVGLWLIQAHSIDYSRDGTRLLVTGRSGRGALKLHDLRRGPPRILTFGRKDSELGEKGEIGSRAYHIGDLTGGAFSPDGRWVITTGAEGGTYVRDARDGSTFAHFPGRGVACRGAAISPGPGTARALVVLEDGSVWIWPLDPLPAAIARRPKLPRELRDLLVTREREIALPLEYAPLPPPGG